MRDNRICGNCIHCGEPMADTDHQCPNDECLTSSWTLPVWPWSRCRGCNRPVMSLNWSWFTPDDYNGDWILVGLLVCIIGIFSYYMPAIAIVGLGFLLINYCFFRIVIPTKMFMLIWQPLLGLELFFLASVFHLSIRMRFIGLILAVGWAVVRGLFSVVRRLHYRRLAEAKERDRLEGLKSAGRWDLITGRDEPEKEKFVKDASDKVNATEWRLVRERTLARLVNFITAILVLGILATYGPGKFLPWKVVSGWFSSTAQKMHQTVTNSPAYKATVADVKKSLEFNAEKANYAYTLLQERGVENTEIDELLEMADDYGKLIDATNKSDLSGEKLFSELKSAFTTPVVPVVAPTLIASSPVEKSYGQKWRESMWISLLIINLILPPLLLIHILFLIAASIIHGCYLITSELGDDIKMSWERIMERQRAKDVAANGISYTPTTSVGAEAAGVGKIVIVDIIMELLQAFFRKFKLMEHFK